MSHEQLPLAAATSAERKKIKNLKRAIARAERVLNNPPDVTEFDCPHCGAPGGNLRKNGWSYAIYHDPSRPAVGCRPRGKNSQYTLAYGKCHDARHAARAAYLRRIMDDAQRAKEKLCPIEKTQSSSSTK